MIAHKLRNCTAPSGPPEYDVLVGGEVVGTVMRTGTLRSCYRWWPGLASTATTEGNVRLLSQPTRTLAVAMILGHLYLIGPEEEA